MGTPTKELPQVEKTVVHPCIWELPRNDESACGHCMKESAAASLFKWECRRLVGLLDTPTAQSQRAWIAPSSSDSLAITSICVHVHWKNAPSANRYAFGGKDGEPSLNIEAVANKRLYCWHLSCGHPGAMNDLNVVRRSPLINAILRGDFLNYPSDLEFSTGEQTFTSPYFLADGIYPSWPIFMALYGVLSGRSKERRFDVLQERVRKDVECLFGCVKGRWHVLTSRLHTWSASQISKIVKVCFLRHNMIVDFRERKGQLGADESTLPTEFEVPDGVQGIGGPDATNNRSALHDDSIIGTLSLTSITARDELRNSLVQFQECHFTS